MAALGVAWDVRLVPDRVYAEARATKARRATRRIPSILQTLETQPLPLDLTEDAEPI
jgi:hypothetical protein